MDIVKRPEFADVRVVGIPRGLLFYRYGELWQTFFRELGREVRVSDRTTRAVFEAGDAASVDECCFASKVYLGHVRSLLGEVDALFIPSIANTGHLRAFCTKFQALPDLVANAFFDERPRIMSCCFEEEETSSPAADAFVSLGVSMGASAREARRAYKTALSAQAHADKRAARAQREELARARRVPEGERAPVILVCAHPYVAHDPYIGGAVEDALRGLGCTVLFAETVDRDRAYRQSFEFSETMPWVVSRELVGGIMMLHDQVDGIVVMSAFPCGPDSMTDDAVARCITGKPMLTLTVDAQSGTAGVETRVESFVDILRYQKRGGYLHE